MIDINIHHVSAAMARTIATDTHEFDTVSIDSENNSTVTLFLPAGTGAAVALAINNAIAPDVPSIMDNVRAAMGEAAE